jgi:hypothetical protein
MLKSEGAVEIRSVEIRSSSEKMDVAHAKVLRR